MGDLQAKTLVFAESFTKANDLLKQLHVQTLNNHKYINGLMPLTQVKNNYPFFIYQQFSIQPSLAQKLLPFFDYIDVHKDYLDEKLIYLKTIKQSLTTEKMLKKIDLKNFQDIVQLDKSFVPPYINNYESRNTISLIDKDIPLSKCDNVESQVYAIFEKVTDLLNQDIPISEIKIVNTQSDDDFQLKKLFRDANIPLVNLKKQSIMIYPVYKEIKQSLKTSSLETTKTLIQNYQSKYPQVSNQVIAVFNRYEDQLIESNREIFISMLDQLMIKTKRQVSGVEIITVDQMDDLNHHYLMMNYIDEYFPKKDIDNDYLTNKQKEMIQYPTSEDINQYRLNLYAHLFDGLQKLYLFYPKVLVDQTRISYLKLKRDYDLIDYQYMAKEKSYLATYDLLRYAIEKNIYESYHQESNDLALLKNTFEDDFKSYNPQFNGILQEDLDLLLERKYTLTGGKLEALKLCPFQYFLKYLLGLDNFVDNHYIYFGNKIHNALEALMTDENFDYKQMVMNSDDFPKDIIYKKPLFDQILIENIDKIFTIIKKFYDNSAYKDIMTEESLSLKINPNDRFLINGIIDKVMIDKENNYYLIIDYKYSQKTFTVDEFDKELKLQLPFYMYMFEKFYDFKPSGLFFRKTGYDREKENGGLDNLLNGVFLNDREQMERLEPTGKQITGLRYTKDGLYKSNRGLTIDDFKAMSKTLESYIYKAAKKIEAGDFEIKPILSEEKNNNSISCLYCDFAHICYSKNKYVKAGDDDEIYEKSN
ncbi:MAG: PD-(D/E)XK nuclease family protein [Tenericutes bacterium]|jgi:ATP-dependent helicase/DNAse subunit B|nr:PD-(D/E)XK nuclease family protein [Mycoplasmatota bacterium]